MSDNIVALPKQPTVNEEAVETLKEMLAEAERGAISEIVAVVTRPSGGTATFFSRVLNISSTIGLLEAIKWDLMDARSHLPKWGE